MMPCRSTRSTSPAGWPTCLLRPNGPRPVRGLPDESGTAPDSIGVRMRPPDHPERVALERAAAASAGPPICARLSTWNSRPQRARAWRHGDHVPRCAQGHALGRDRRCQFLDGAALSTRSTGLADLREAYGLRSLGSRLGPRPRLPPRRIDGVHQIHDGPPRQETARARPGSAGWRRRADVSATRGGGVVPQRCHRPMVSNDDHGQHPERHRTGRPRGSRPLRSRRPSDGRASRVRGNRERSDLSRRLRRVGRGPNRLGSETRFRRPDPPGNGGLFRRVDGPRPRWDWIYEWAWSSPNPDMPMWTGMRGLTPLRDPRDGHDVLLGAREQPGVIERIDPSRNHAVTLELDVRNYFSKIWYGGQLYRDVTLIAYNDMTAAVHPKTGEPIHLIGLWVLHPERQSELGASSWYLVRYRDGSYAHGRVFDPGDSTIRTRGGLRGTRSIVVAPFAEDRARVFYFCCFDAYAGPHQDTAWIYRAAAPE